MPGSRPRRRAAPSNSWSIELKMLPVASIYKDHATAVFRRPSRLIGADGPWPDGAVTLCGPRRNLPELHSGQDDLVYSQPILPNLHAYGVAAAGREVDIRAEITRRAVGVVL